MKPEIEFRIFISVLRVLPLLNMFAHHHQQRHVDEYLELVKTGTDFDGMWLGTVFSNIEPP